MLKNQNDNKNENKREIKKSKIKEKWERRNFLPKSQQTIQTNNQKKKALNTIKFKNEQHQHNKK